MTLRQAQGPEAVVVGSGIAGLVAALHATAAGCRVTLVTKDVLEHTNTRFAQGGIAAVMFDDDRVDDHIRDTLVAGAGLCDPVAVRVLAEEGPARIRELVAAGVAFDRADDGAWLKGLEAAHSYPRILHAGGDATGTAIEHALVARLWASEVRVVEHAFLVDLVVRSGRVAGVDLLVGERVEHPVLRRAQEDCPAQDHPAGSDPALGRSPALGAAASAREVGDRARPGARVRIHADAVILATGGAGELYARTTNPAVATGDGIAAALRAGAAAQDLEFVQFHPTVLATGIPFLVSEAVRGEGAVLRDQSGRRFLQDVHPDVELAPRDVVSRGVAEAMRRQGGPVLLDATAVHSTDAAERAAFLARRFPTIDTAVRARGLDWAVEPIPVTPAAHYLMGGVTTDLRGRTCVPGLYAVGELARTGVHGANRLASNSLLEGAVFGARAGDAVALDALTPSPWPVPRRETTFPARNHVQSGSSRSKWLLADGERFTRAALQQLMWDEAGLVRDGAGLGHAASVLAGWRTEARTPRTERELEDENLLLVASELVAAALRRPDSIGAHYRSDAPLHTTPQNHTADPADPAAQLESSAVLRSYAREVAAC